MPADERRREEVRRRFMEAGISLADLEEAVSIELGESTGCTRTREWHDSASETPIQLVGPSRPVRLAFYDQGVQLGTVEWVDGMLLGKAALTTIVVHHMERGRCSVPQAMESLDGWSNGYLVTRIIPFD